MSRSGAILLTGFEPFGDHPVNPSGAVAEHFDGVELHGYRIATAILPVAGAEAGGALEAAVQKHRPHMVLPLGLASGRAKIALERVAINVLDFSIPDNLGAQTADVPVVEGGPAAYFSTLPVKAILAAWAKDGLPGYLSNTAGTYICNQVMYHALHLGRREGFRAGFIHLPDLPALAASKGPQAPSVALDIMTAAVGIALEVALTVEEDVKLAAGAVD